MSFSNIFSSLFSISITGVLIVFLVLFFVYLLGNLLILFSNKIDFESKNDEEDIKGIIDSRIKDISEGLSFEESKLYTKIKRFLYVPLIRLPKNEYKKWKFLDPVLFDKDNKEQQIIYKCFLDDYKVIQKQVECCFEKKLKFYTFNGMWNYLQIRTKDSKPYTPIILDGFEFSNKQRAFYIKANFFKKLNENKIGIS